MAGPWLHNRRYCMRYALFGAFVIVVVYIPLSVFFTVHIRKSESSTNVELFTTKPKMVHMPIQMSMNSNRTHRGPLLQLHDLNLEPDGSVDLTLNMNLNELVRLVKAYTDGSFDGEMTMNALPPPLSFLVPNSDVCKKAPNLLALIYVHTAPENVKKRDLLRQTWANTQLFADERTRVVFLLGRPRTTLDMDKLLAEHERHHDLVIGDFVDAYRNLTLKALTGLQWVSTFCPDVKYVIKADDDAFINVFEIFKLLRRETSNRLIACALWSENGMPIMRDPSKCKKWCVHFYEFPGRTHFPQYCAGLALIMSGTVVREMHAASVKTPLFWIDDVYLTGVLAKKVQNIHYVNLLKNFTLKEEWSYADITGNLKKPLTYLITTTKNEKKFQAMWNATLHRLAMADLKQLSNKVLDSNQSLRKKFLI